MTPWCGNTACITDTLQAFGSTHQGSVKRGVDLFISLASLHTFHVYYRYRTSNSLVISESEFFVDDSHIQWRKLHTNIDQWNNNSNRQYQDNIGSVRSFNHACWGFCNSTEIQTIARINNLCELTRKKQSSTTPNRCNCINVMDVHYRLIMVIACVLCCKKYCVSQKLNWKLKYAVYPLSGELLLLTLLSRFSPFQWWF